MFYCICSEKDKNIIGEIKTEQEKAISTQDLLKKHNLEGKILWTQTRNCAYPLNATDKPFIDQPELILKMAPREWDIPSNTFFIFSNISQDSRILFLTPKHNSKQKIPRLSIRVPESEFQSNINKLLNIIESTFPDKVKADSLIENDKKLDKKLLIKDVFDKLKSGIDITVSLKISDACNSSMSKRAIFAREIIDSELQYVNDLNALESVWMKSFQQQPIFGDFHFKTLFQDVPKMLAAQRKIFQIFQNCFNDCASEYGRCFFECIPYFEESTDYISHFSGIDKFIKSKKEDPEYIEYCKKHSEQLEGKDLDNFLIAPVQRMCKYHLLLDKLQKATPVNHPDYLFLGPAYDVMFNIRHKADEMKKFVDEQKILEDIQLRNYRNFNYLTPDRIFLKRFDGITVARQQRRSFIVCNDYVFLIDYEDLMCRFKSPSDAVPLVPLNDGLSVRIDPNKIDDKTARGNDVKFISKEERTEFLNLIKRVKF